MNSLHRAMRTLVFFVAFISLSAGVLAQRPRNIEVIGTPVPNSDIFFVSDVHNHVGDLSFIHAMGDFVFEKYGVRDIAVELSRSWAYMVNGYIKNGDSLIFSYKVNASFLAVLNYWKSLNKGLPKDKQITLYGVDFERMEFIRVLRSVFKKHSGGKASALCKYIDGLPDSVSSSNYLYKNARLRKETYSKAHELFETEKTSLVGMLVSDYSTIASILENPVTEQRFGHRNGDMEKSISEQLANKKFICFLGGAHTSVYNYFSTVARYRRSARDKEITLITEVCKNYYHSSTDSTEGLQDVVVGPVYIRKNNSIMSLAFGKYHKPGSFTLIDQAEFKDFLKKDNKSIPTYYVFSDMLNE